MSQITPTFYTFSFVGLNDYGNISVPGLLKGDVVINTYSTSAGSPGTAGPVASLFAFDNAYEQPTVLVDGLLVQNALANVINNTPRDLSSYIFTLTIIRPGP